jgi:ribose 5-phosphate isomerase A
VRLEDHAALDLTIDGADEVAPDLSLIKGGGGALLREKLIAQASQRTIIIVDGSKCVSRLGTNWAIPIEVVPFGWSHQQRYLEAQGAAVTRRLNSDGTAFFTDNGNLVLDANFGMVDDPQRLADKLKSRTGIVEHGLFIGLATDAIVAYTDRVTHYRGHMPAEADR